MKRVLVTLLLILILAVEFRFIKLDNIPSGFVPEEVSSSWDAYSVMRSGRDEWGQVLPIVFRETGGYKLALSSYLMIPTVAIFGLNEFAVRFPTALAGVLSVFLTYFVSFELFKRKKIALIASFLLAISPWHISMSRYAQGVNWGIPFFLAGILFFIKSQNKPKLLIISSIFFALTYHTYFNYLIFTLIFIFIIAFARRNYLKTKSGIFIFLSFLLIQIFFLLPFITQNSAGIRFNQVTSVQNIGLINKINEHRQACNYYYPPQVCKIIYNKPVEKITEIAKNLVNHFSTTIFFLYGSQLGQSGMPQNWGFLYLFEFPLILWGIIVLIKDKKFPLILVWWGFLYAIPSSLAGDAHIWRMMTLIPLPSIVVAYGLIHLLEFLHKKIIKVGIILIMCFSILRFTTDYFAYFPYFQGSYSYYGFRDLYKYIGEIEKDYDYIVIAPLNMNFNQLYIYYLFYSQYDPLKYQKGEEVERIVGEQNWVWVNRIGKWYFVGELGKVQYPLTERTLLVSDNASDDWIVYDKTLKTKVIHTINHINGDIAFRIMKLEKIY